LKSRDKKCTAKLPERMIVGYPGGSICDSMVVDAVKDGVNVVIWFSVVLGSDSMGNPSVL